MEETEGPKRTGIAIHNWLIANLSECFAVYVKLFVCVLQELETARREKQRCVHIVTVTIQ